MMDDKDIGPAHLSAALNYLDYTQAQLGKYFPGWAEGTPEFVRTTFLALHAEVDELMAHFDWKQWKEPHVWNAGELVEAAYEFADILAFLGYIVLFLEQQGVHPSDLARAYERKTELNHLRLQGKVPGYGSPGGVK